MAQMLRIMQLLSQVEEGENLGGSPTLPAGPWGGPGLGPQPAPPAGACPVLCPRSALEPCFCTEQRSGLKLLELSPEGEGPESVAVHVCITLL